MATEYLDRLPTDLFVLDVVREKARSRNWVALMIDVDPDEFLEPPYVRAKRSGWFRIPGKYKNRDDAWDSLQEMMLTRH